MSETLLKNLINPKKQIINRKKLYLDYSPEFFYPPQKGATNLLNWSENVTKVLVIKIGVCSYLNDNMKLLPVKLIY